MNVSSVSIVLSQNAVVFTLTFLIKLLDYLLLKLLCLAFLLRNFFLARTGRRGFAMFACYEFPIAIYAVFKHHNYFLEQCSTYMLR